MDLRAGLDDVEKKKLTLPGLELRSLGRPACIPITLSRLNILKRVTRNNLVRIVQTCKQRKTRNAYAVLTEKSEGTRSLERRTNKLEDIIKIDIK